MQMPMAGDLFEERKKPCVAGAQSRRRDEVRQLGSMFCETSIGLSMQVRSLHCFD